MRGRFSDDTRTSPSRFTPAALKTLCGAFDVAWEEVKDGAIRHQSRRCAGCREQSYRRLGQNRLPQSAASGSVWRLPRPPLHRSARLRTTPHGRTGAGRLRAALRRTGKHAHLNFNAVLFPTRLPASVPPVADQYERHALLRDCGRRLGATTSGRCTSTCDLATRATIAPLRYGRTRWTRQVTSSGSCRP